LSRGETGLFESVITRRASALLLLAAIILIPLLNPIGFVGGGGDDNHYLDAARCWVAAGGVCVPPSHWWTRWPTIAPMAASIGLFGESRLSVAIGPFIWWASVVLLVAQLGRLWFDRSVGLVAALLVATLPIVSSAALQPTADMPELAAQLAALTAATLAFQRQSRWWALAGGVAAGIAFQARDTSVAFCFAAALAWLTLPRDRRAVLLWAVPGLIGAMAAEMLAYFVATGDPLLRYRLALGHATVPSAELPAGFDTRRSPLFNPDYIAAWKREQDIRVHWAIDPWLNLIASPRLGRTLLAAAVVLLFARSGLPKPSRRIIALILAFALLVSALLIYGLAIDPKPRMFMLLGAASSLAAAAAAVWAWRRSRQWVSAAILGLLVVINIRTLVELPSRIAAEASARQWIAAYPRDIEIDGATLSALTLVPETHSLPAEHSGRPLRMMSTEGTCAELARGARSVRAAVVDAVPASPNGGGGEICLMRIVSKRDGGPNRSTPGPALKKTA
jgi:4-amino-4-deoxy-L-arabinose transferase-like glycosyltransferase